jgi:tricorn protease
MSNLIAFLLFTFLFNLLHAQETRLLRDPDISDTKIVFAYANDLWTVDKAGGTAQRLTSFPGVESIQDFLLMENGSLSQVNTRATRMYI